MSTPVGYTPPKKIMFVGDACVGKTTILTRYAGEEFQHEYVRTEGVEVTSIVRGMNAWDCAGDKSGIGMNYCIGASACVIVFDLTFEESFDNVTDYYNQFTAVGNGLPIVLVGNKCDSEDRVVTKEMIQKYLTTLPGMYMRYFDVSAKSGFNVVKLFEYLSSVV